MDSTVKGAGEGFLKKDCVGLGATAKGRSRNRVIVKLDSSGRMAGNLAWFWRHDNRVCQLDKGFFTPAQLMRSMS
ncbi:MAG: hypothetical protein ACKVPY_03860 [Paracoccaceae bacterium]